MSNILYHLNVVAYGLSTEEKVTISLEETQRYWRKRYFKLTELATSQPSIILTVCVEVTSHPSKDDGQRND